MVKKLILRVKTEETSKVVKPRKTFLSRDTTILGKIGTN